MPLAGEIIVAGQIPGERIATTVRTDASANITTEAVIDTVVAPVVVGRTYRVTWTGELNSTVAGDDAIPRIREDSLTGNLLQASIIDLPVANRFPRTFLDAEYTADATEDKTFTLSLERSSGSGTVTSTATSSQPNYLYVDYIRG